MENLILPRRECAKVEVAEQQLMTAYDFLFRFEPNGLAIMYDPVKAIYQDDLRGAVLGRLWGAPSEMRMCWALEPNNGMLLTALPIYVWEAVYSWGD
jgi:hypothetical protein